MANKKLNEYRGFKVGSDFVMKTKPRYWNSVGKTAIAGLKTVKYPYRSKIAYINHDTTNYVYGFRDANGYGWSFSSIDGGQLSLDCKPAKSTHSLSMPTIREFPPEINEKRQAEQGEWIKTNEGRFYKYDGSFHFKNYVIATEGEIERYFLVQAQRRGFGVGTKFHSIIKKDGRMNLIKTPLVNFRFVTEKGNKDSFHMGELCISVNGNWAKPLNAPEQSINYKFLRNEVQGEIKNVRRESERLENLSRRKSVRVTSSERLTGNVTRIRVGYGGIRQVKVFSSS
jgi:hypothetical protein